MEDKNGLKSVEDTSNPQRSLNVHVSLAQGNNDELSNFLWRIYLQNHIEIYIYNVELDEIMLKAKAETTFKCVIQ